MCSNALVPTLHNNTRNPSFCGKDRRPRVPGWYGLADIRAVQATYTVYVRRRVRVRELKWVKNDSFVLGLENFRWLPWALHYLNMQLPNKDPPGTTCVFNVPTSLEFRIRWAALNPFGSYMCSCLFDDDNLLPMSDTVFVWINTR